VPPACTGEDAKPGALTHHYSCLSSRGCPWGCRGLGHPRPAITLGPARAFPVPRIMVGGRCPAFLCPHSLSGIGKGQGAIMRHIIYCALLIATWLCSTASVIWVLDFGGLKWMLLAGACFASFVSSVALTAEFTEWRCHSEASPIVGEGQASVQGLGHRQADLDQSVGRPGL
jgi:hypothetical protein